MKLTNVFIDYKTKLQSYLDAIVPNLFVCINEKDIDYKLFRQDKIYVVISKLLGTTTTDSVSIPIQLKIYTTQSPEYVIGTFVGLSKAKANSSYEDVFEVEEGVMETGIVFEKFGTPAVYEADVQFAVNNHWTCLVAYVELVILFNIGNVRKIAIDGVEQPIINGVISFSTEQMSNRETGDELNKQKNRTATTNLQFTLINKTSNFTKSIFQMAFGQENRNKIFNVDVELTDGQKVEDVSMIVVQSVLNFEKNTPKLPVYNITMTIGDERELQ